MLTYSHCNVLLFLNSVWIRGLETAKDLGVRYKVRELT